MPRPRKGTEQVFYDTFADWPIEDQAAALKVLNELHRQRQREARRQQPPSPVPDLLQDLPEGVFPEVPKGVIPAEVFCPSCGKAIMEGDNCNDSFHVPF
jgi:hypothetical protein